MDAVILGLHDQQDGGAFGPTGQDVGAEEINWMQENLRNGAVQAAQEAAARFNQRASQVTHQR